MWLKKKKKKKRKQSEYIQISCFCSPHENSLFFIFCCRWLFFWEENTAESKKWERGDVMSGSPTHQKQLQHTASWSPSTATADPRLPTTQRSAYKRLQHVSERRDRNQSRLAGSNLISRRRRRRLRSERATPQPTDILTLICWGLFGGSLGFSCCWLPPCRGRHLCPLF